MAISPAARGVFDPFPFLSIAFVIAVATLVIGHAATAQDPSHPQADSQKGRALYTRGVALEDRGYYAEALPVLMEAAVLAPGDAEIVNRFGEAIERIGSFDAAIDTFQRAVALDPAYRKATNNLILTLVKAGRAGEALTRARADLASAPNDPEKLFTVGLAQSESNLDGAIEAFRRVLTLAPRHGLARYNLALALKRADRPAEAAEELRRVIEIEPRPEAHYTLGVIHWQQGALDRAVDALRAAIAAKPAYGDAHYALGTVLKAKGDLKGAADALRRAIELMPESAGPNYVLSQVLRAQGDERGAARHLSQSERLRQLGERQHEASVLTFLGIQKLEAGDAAAAVDLFTQATATFEQYAPAHYQKGRALQRLGKIAEARAAYARAHELHPALVPPPDFPPK